MIPPGLDGQGEVESVEARFERLKDEFLSAVGHELRTPLTAIQGTLKLLQGGVVDPSSDKGRRLIGLAVSNSDRLQKMVEGLLDVNRLKSGQTPLQKEQCDLDALLRTVAAKVEARLGARTLTTHVEAGLLWADKVRLADVLDKLLDNAVRYSPEASEIVLSVLRQGTGILFSVQDHGVGLSPADTERIFDDFGQIDRSDTRQTGGAGLSLAICRHVVRQHGGRIWVESRPGEGACFFVMLPAPQEQVLVENATSFREWVQHVRDMFWLANVQLGKLLYVSRAVEDICGRAPEAFYAGPGTWMDAVHPDDMARVRPLLDVDPPARVEYRIRRPDGSIRWVKDRRYTVRNEFGALESIVGIVEDITEQHLALEELRLMNQELERRVFKRSSEFAAMFNCNPEAIVFTDRDRCIRMGNPAFTTLLGYRPEEVVGQPVGMLAGPSSPPWSEPVGRVTTVLEDHCRHKDGSEIPVERVIECVFTPDGTSLGYLMILRDLRVRRRLEAQVRQSERIAAIGLLADGIAHDFNNLLTVVGGNAGLLKDTLAGQEGDELLTEIAWAVERGTALTGQLLSFSQPVGDLEALDVNVVVEQSRLLLRCVAGENVDIRVEKSSRPARVRTELFSLQQMLMQLVLNAREVMPSGGMLSIQVQPVVLRQALPSASRELPPGSYVLLSVNDNGSGMEAEAIHRMFEPFFTTRSGRKGVGLSTVDRMARDQGGGVVVQSGPGRGTTFQIYLPSLDDEVAVVPGERPPTVLLVEDDAAVRRLVSKVLLREGYHVLEAVDGMEGLEMVRGSDVDLVITDVVMPKLGGDELAAQARSLRPETRILFMSGYRDERLTGPDVHFIPKPLVLPDLVAKVHELLVAREAERSLGIASLGDKIV